MKIYYGIIGAGGHGREVMPIAKDTLAKKIHCDKAELLFVIEDDIETHFINGYRVFSLEAFKALPGKKYFNIAIANSYVRERISYTCLNSGMQPFSIISKNTVILDDCHIGDGCILSPFTAVTSNVRIGNFFHGNNFSNIAHDCLIGDFVTFAPGVKCNGNVHIKDHAYIGAGAIIKQGSAEKPTIIGQAAVIGMGAVVTKDVPDNMTVVGNPARAIERK